MTNVVKNRIMRILAVIAIVCVSMVFAFSINTTKAQTIAVEGFGTQAEAGVNVSDNANEEGIAFYTDIDTSIYGENVQVYTIVTPEANLVDGDITSLRKETSVDLDGWRIKAVKLEGEGAVKTFMATITFDGLSEAQLAKAYATKLVARSYIEQEGEVIYAQDNLTATSIKEVAQANLAEAIVSEAVVTEENVEKWVKYAGITDVKAYYETTSEVQFIDQDLDSATVYAVNGAEFTELGDIQNSKLSNLELAMAGAGEKTQFIIIKDGKAIVTNAIEATQIIDSKEEFISFFGKKFATGAEVLDAMEEYLNEDGAEWKDVFSTRPSGTYAGNQTVNGSSAVISDVLDGYYVLATDITFDAGETLTTSVDISSSMITTWLAANPTSKIAGLVNEGTINFTGNGTQSSNAANNRTLAVGATFDGLGHTIYNIQYLNGYGLIGKIYGTFKNLAIVNAKFSSASNSVALGIETSTKSQLQNLYVQIAQVGVNTDLAGNRQAGLVQRWNYGHYSNIVIEYPDVNESFAGEYGTGYLDYMGYDTATTEDRNSSSSNIIAITKTKALGAYTVNSTATSGRRILLASNDADITEINGVEIKLTTDGGTFAKIAVVQGATRYDDYATLRSANADLSAFDNGLWDISSGAPVWASLVKENVQILVDEEVVEQINFVANEGTTKTFEIVSDLMDIDYTVEIADPTIATYADGVITKVANGGETTLTYSYEIAGETITGSYKIVIEKEYPVLGTIVVDNNTTALPELAVDGAITSVKDFNLGTEYLVEGAIAFTNDTNEVKSYTVIITTENGTEYKATIESYTAIIEDFDEFNHIFGYQTYNLTVTQSVKNDSTGETVWTKALSTEVEEDLQYFSISSGYGSFKFLYQHEGTGEVGVVPAGFSRVADTFTMSALPLNGTYVLANDITFDETDSKWNPYDNVNFKPRTVTKITENVETGLETYKESVHNTYLGDYRVFNGVLNGNGYSIIDMVFNGADRGGIVGRLAGTVKNLGMKNATIVGTNGANTSMAVIAGYVVSAEAVIENVFVELASWNTGLNVRNSALVQSITSGPKNWTLKDTIVIAPEDTTWASNQYVNGALWVNSASQYNTPAAENVLVISKTPWLGRYSTKATLAENVETVDGAESPVHVAGIKQFADIASAMTAGFAKVGNWVITAEAISWVK